MLIMINPFDFGGHSSKVNVTMGIIDKCGVRGDATLRDVIFKSSVCLFVHNSLPLTCTYKGQYFKFG